MLVEFDGLSLQSLPGVVMIPRATSIALVDRVVRHVGSSPAVVADVGTGSGALAIALRAGLSDRVHVRLGDLLDPLPRSLDVIAANLPYLPWHESGLHPDLA